MRAVNLIPQESRSGGRQIQLASDSLGATHGIVAALVIVAILVLMRVLAGNTVSDRTQTLAVIQRQVATEQATAQRIGDDASFIQAAEQRENAIRSIAAARFPWQSSLDQLAEVMPATTSLSSLSATSTASSTAAATGPLFTLSGCADTANQDGTATLLRRLQTLSGSPQIGFQSSTRTAHCGNSFDITINYGSGTATTGTATQAASTTSSPTSTTGASTTTTAATTTTPSTTTSGSAG